MYTFDKSDTRHGISAVLLAGEAFESAVLDLAAVLSGLVSDNFEIVVVAHGARALDAVANLRASRPGMTLRLVAGDSIANGYEAARFDLVFVAAGDGHFDVRELNRVYEAIQSGADVAVGYRRRRTDRVVRRLQRWGWGVDVDCAFSLVRHQVLRAVSGRNSISCARIVSRARRGGYRVVDVPVSDRRHAFNSQPSALNAVSQH